MSRDKKSIDFNVYYLNFPKVYELSMMINNVILSSVQKENTKSFEKQYGYTSSISAKGSKAFLDGVKATLSAEAKESTISSSRIVENLDVKTTKSILLRRIIERCNEVNSFDGIAEGDLIKIDNVKLAILDEESLRQFLILRRDALKGFRVEGMEVNNLISSMLQDYSYILKGSFYTNEGKSELIIKIPLELQNEFENKYSINDLLIGHVSVIGLYKEVVDENFISSNTFTYFQNMGMQLQQQNKVIKSNSNVKKDTNKTFVETAEANSHFIDVIAVIQDVIFETPKVVKLSRWERIKKWFKSRRKRNK